MDQQPKRDTTNRDQLIRKRGVARGMLTRMQTFLDSGNTDINQLQVRLNSLPTILSKFETVQDELESTDDFDYSEDRASFETQYFEVEAKFHELLHNIHSEADRSSDRSSSSSSIRSTHSSSAQIRLPTIELPSFDGDACKWLHYRDTFQALIVNNQSLSHVQKLHYLISSLKAEAKSLIVNLPITNDNFTVAWDLITQRYNNIKLIAMKHVNHLFDRPQVKRGDASSLRHLINHMSSHMNALNALLEDTSMHDLLLNHLVLSALDSESHREWELRTSAHTHISPITEVIEFLENKCKALELLQTNQSSSITTPSRHIQPTGNKFSHSPRCNLTTQSQCPLCKGPHRLFACNKFIKMNSRERMNCAKQLKVCLNCLQLNSQNHKCSTGTCRTCKKPHHSLLHINTTNSYSTEKHTNETPTVEVNTYCSFKGNLTNRILLATAIVEVRNKANQYIPCRVLLDSGSQMNFITERYVQILRLSKSQTPVHVQGINNVNTSTHYSVPIHLRSRISDWHATTTCAVLPTITGTTPVSTLDIQSWNIPTNIKLADENFNKPGPIDMLIGADLFYEMLLPDNKTRPGFPVVQNTVLGWILSGKTPIPTIPDERPHSFLVQDITNLEVNLNRFWEIEQVEPSFLTPEQQSCEHHFITHTIRQPNGRFSVRLPVAGEPHQLGTSRHAAEVRLLAIERRLERDPRLKAEYCRFMKEYEDLGHMEPVNFPQKGTICYYLPHHPVFKEDSTTTKTRIVFDGGAKSSTGISLNDILQVGATVQPDLYSIILRFRTHQVCFTADIEKMYRQISIQSQDRNLQRILWRHSPDEPIREYQLTTVTYGTSSAPFLATRCLKKLADDSQTNHPRAAQVLGNDFYVDDLLSGASTVQEAIELQQDLSYLLQGAGFKLRKWASNYSEFLDTIPLELQETQTTLSLDNDNEITTLGLQWNPKHDYLQVKNNSAVTQANSTVSTKRKVLASIASIFDPLGLLNPSVITYKLFLQKLWQDQLTWDDQLPRHLQEEWEQLCHTIPKLSLIKIPRKVVCANATNIQLHGFADSSEQAYGACIYIRSTSNSQTLCRLLCATSKVAPIKRVTIPRLELSAAVLLAKLYKRTTRALNIPIHSSYLWTDSAIVLTWIQNPSNRWKTFVGNRVASIQEKTATAVWRHVPSQANPADIISRGMDLETLLSSTLWWNGPHWLLLDSTSWPASEFEASTDTSEIRTVHVARMDTNEDLTQRFSKLNRLIRVIATCKRFIQNCRQPKANRQTTPFTTQDLTQALNSCVKMVQHTAYAQEFQDLVSTQVISKSSSLKTLHPFLDKEGILRVGGRLQQSSLPYQSMHQIILPSNHHFTKLVVKAEHLRLHHAGSQLLTASLRDRYWIPRIKTVIKTVIHHCHPCYRFKAQASQQLMGELPAARVQPSRAFQTVGIDYAGPIMLRVGLPRSKATTKGYIAIFICFATKAIHLEVVTSLTTEAFLAALRRFVARRGRPKTIWSDNGTNFQGAANELHHLYQLLHSSSKMATIRDFLTSEGCEWKFIPPHGPHFGGLWEAAVKSMKFHLRRTLASHLATYEELYTLLTEIEACLNSRPLCSLSNDPHGYTYLSPGHFLIGQPLTQLPSADYTNVKTNRLSRWQIFQQQIQNFWKQWSRDYLNELQTRQRWQRSFPNLQPGDLVLLRDNLTTPLQWPTAVIVGVHPGSDTNVRVVTVKTSKGTFKRPISKICLLPHWNDEQ